jgi:hypothetical protein
LILINGIVNLSSENSSFSPTVEILKAADFHDLFCLVCVIYLVFLVCLARVNIRETRETR